MLRFPTIHSDDLIGTGCTYAGLPIKVLDTVAHEARQARDIRAMIELNIRGNVTSTTYKELYNGEGT